MCIMVSVDEEINKEKKMTHSTAKEINGKKMHNHDTGQLVGLTGGQVVFIDELTRDHHGKPTYTLAFCVGFASACIEHVTDDQFKIVNQL